MSRRCKERFAVIKRKRLREWELKELAAEAGEGELPLKRLRRAGRVLETRVVEERTQGWNPEDIMAINLEALTCRVSRWRGRGCLHGHREWM